MSGAAPPAYRRLILELCHGAADAQTVRAMAEFARLLGLDLHCVFIEDEAVLALAELPFAREIRLPTHEWSPIDTQRIADDFRHAEAQARRLLDETTQRLGVTNVLEVLRGDPAACIAGLCCASDIVVIAEPAGPAARTASAFTRLHAAAHSSAAAVLLLPSRHKPRHGPVVVVLADIADASLDIGAKIAATAKQGLLILLENGTRRMGRSATERAEALGVAHEQIATRQVVGMQTDDVLSSLVGRHESLVVMTRAASAAGDIAGASRIAAARGVPVLLVEPLQEAGGIA